MSKTIDERVVSMQFDNKNFENNVHTSMSTLDKLKQSLNLSGASKGLENVSNAAKNFDMSGMGAAVDTVKLRFSALEVMAVTALANITNSAINTGKRMISALTIEPIKTGFEEYELKMNSIQTIMSNVGNKGKTMEDVNKVLDELNTYADKTIYNFAEMTRNIGTFTAAGVGLEESAKAIQGIANLAATQGSTSQQASTAMYQLSQALAAGTVKLQDWNSVVNANMGGPKFQEALKATAREHGVAVDEMIKQSGSFRESLQKGWITADILNETLGKFTVDGAKKYAKSMMESGKWTQKQADALIKEAQSMEDAATKVKTFTQLWDTLKEAAQSGWAQTWEMVIGDFEEAKGLYTQLSTLIGGVIDRSAKARNEMVKEWKELGGRTILNEAFFNIFEDVARLIKPITQAFREIFPPLTAQRMLDFTKKFRDLTEKMRISDATVEKLKNVFKGLFSVIKVGVDIIKTIIKVAVKLLSNLAPLGKVVLNIASGFGKLASSLSGGVSKGLGLLSQGLGKVLDLFDKSIDGVKNFISSITGHIPTTGFDTLYSVLTGIWGIIQKVGSKMSELGSGIADAFINPFKNGDAGALLDVINGGIFASILLGIKNFVNSFGSASDLIDDLFSGLGKALGSVKGIFDSVRESLEAYQQNLKAGTLQKIAIAIGILAASILVISTINPERLSASLGAITMLFANLMGTMTVFGKMSLDLKGTAKAISIMIGVSTAVLILAAALKTISTLKTDEMVRGIAGIGALSGIVVAVAKAMSAGKGAIVKGATNLVIFAAAIKILASACEDLSSLKWDEIKRGLAGVGGLMVEVAIFLKVAKFNKNATSAAIGIAILAGALKILASACSDFGSMDWPQIGKGLGSIGALLLELALFTKLTANAKNVIATGASLAIIGASMKLFASAMKSFGNLELGEIGKGLLAMAGALAAVTLATRLMPKNMVSIGAGLVVVGYALSILADALTTMGGMAWDEVGRGITVLGGSMAILAIGLLAMKSSLAGAVALVVAAGALAILVPVLKSLGEMKPASIAKALLAIAGAFVVIGVAGTFLAPLVPTLLGLAGSFALLGIAAMGIGVGLAAVAIGLTTLAAAGTAGATAIVASLTIIVTGIAGLIPAVAKKFGEAIVVFCQVIADGATAIGEAIKAIILTSVDVLVECVPALTEGFFQLLVSVLSSLAEHTPELTDHLMTILIGFINGVAERLPELIQAGVNLIMQFFAGIVSALQGIDIEVLLKGIAGVGLLSGLMLALSAVAALIPSAMVGVLGMGVVIAELALVLAAVGALAQIPGLEWLIGEGGDFLQKIGTAIGQFVGGIVGGVAQGATASLPQIGENLSAFMKSIQPFIEGAKSIDAGAMEGVKTLAQTILLLTAADILDAVTSFITGGSSLTEFGKQLVPFGQSMAQYSAAVTGIDTGAITASATAAKGLSQVASSLPTSGGVKGFFTGEANLSEFGTEMVNFGKKLKEYGTAVAGIDVASITNSASAAKALAQVASALPKQGGLKGLFAGKSSLESFGADMVNFGKNLAKFSEKVSGVSISAITALGPAVKAVVSALKMTTTVDTSKVDAFIKAASKLGKLKIDAGTLAKSADSVKSAVNAMMKAIKTSISSSKASVSSAMKTALSGMPKEVVTAGKQAVSEIKKSMDQFVKTISSYKSKVTSAFKGVVSGAAAGVKVYYSSFVSSGMYLGSGLVVGINSKRSQAYAAGYSLGQIAAKGVKDGEKVNSPSKLTIEYGKSLGEGLMVGIDRISKSVYSSAYGLGEHTAKSLSKAVSKISSVLDSDMDMQPTIRPVVDLSNVTAGSKAISGMFGTNPSVGAFASANAANAMMNRNQNGVNDDVVSAIKDLKKTIGQTSGDSYNINGITYDDGSNVAEAVQSLIRAAKVERRI